MDAVDLAASAGESSPPLLRRNFQFERAGVTIDIVQDRQDFAGDGRVGVFVQRILLPIVRRAAGIGISGAV